MSRQEIKDLLKDYLTIEFNVKENFHTKDLTVIIKFDDVEICRESVEIDEF